MLILSEYQPARTRPRSFSLAESSRAVLRQFYGQKATNLSSCDRVLLFRDTNLLDSYPAIEPHTPRSVWVRTKGDISMVEIVELLRPFGSAPVMVKDFVKSRKHEWALAHPLEKNGRSSRPFWSMRHRLSGVE